MKKFKGALAVVLGLTMMFSLTACGGSSEPDQPEGETPDTEDVVDEGDQDETDEPGEIKKVGVLIYNGADTYIATVRQALEEIAASDGTIEYEFVDGEDNQGTQTNQLDALIAKGVDGLLVNIVDFKAAPQVIETIKASGIPTVFFNRDITEDLDEADLDNMIFVGTDAPQAGVMQGDMAKELWEAQKDVIDRNGDGKVQYVMLHGGLDNAEAVARTEESIKVLTDAGIEVEELGMQVAEWDTSKAKEAVDAWMSKEGDNIEIIFANNDDMALGALAAVQAMGYNQDNDDKYIPIFGVDATSGALDKIDSGQLEGTVMQDNVAMADTVTDLILNKMAGKDWLDGTSYELFEDNKSVRVDYAKITR